MELLTSGDEQAFAHVVFAHGAGAPMDSEFMEEMSGLLNGHGLQVSRFEFPYMQKRRVDGKRRPPDRIPKLIDCFLEAMKGVQPQQLVLIGGKSMGGRVASLVAAELSIGSAQSAGKIDGWFALGYPFHPPGKPEKLRIQHLPEITVPGLILQGSRDPFGNESEDLRKHLPNSTQLTWIPDGNHDLVPRKRSGIEKLDNWQMAAEQLAMLAKAFRQPGK